MGTNLMRCLAVLFIITLLSSNTIGCSAMTKAEQSAVHAISITDFAERKVTLNEIPQRIVALGNGEVEIIYALGGELVGRPSSDSAHLDQTVQEVPVIGSVHTVDLERIAIVQPEVVLANNPINYNDIPILESIGTKVVLTQANSIADIRGQIELFGKLLQKETKAAELVSQLDSELLEVGTSQEPKLRVLMVYGAPGTYLAALPNSLAGNVLETAGGLNVAAEFPRLQNFPQYAQLNTERVVEANPDFILIMTHGSTDEVEKGFVREMQSNPAWNSINAVVNQRIHVLPSELFGTNPGTRVVDAVKWLKDMFAS